MIFSKTMKDDLISLHGGHSGQFCCHASDNLEDVVRKYIRLGFRQVGITEHIPPPNDRFRYPDEIEQGFSKDDLLERFCDYFGTLDRLKKKYGKQIRIYAGMETETVTGYKDHVSLLVSRFKPDYLVGSVHHVNDICFDYSKEEFERAVRSCGSIDALYTSYFDLQYEMIVNIKPFIVGHFDLVRIFDPDYEHRLVLTEIEKKVDRNLELIRSMGLFLDFNLRPLARGEKKPYIADSILEKARRMGIGLVPGDDSHGVDEAGGHVRSAVRFLHEKGFNTKWPVPRLITG